MFITGLIYLTSLTTRAKKQQVAAADFNNNKLSNNVKRFEKKLVFYSVYDAGNGVFEYLPVNFF